MRNLVILLAGCGLFEAAPTPVEEALALKATGSMRISGELHGDHGITVTVTGGEPGGRVLVGASAWAGGERHCRDEVCFALGKPFLQRVRVELDDTGEGERRFKIDGVDASGVVFVQGASLGGDTTEFTNLWAHKVPLTDIEDADGDGLSDAAEAAAASNPNNPDSDGDGLDDGWEAALRSNIGSPDSDSDGLTDGAEWYEHGTLPADPDTDRDGLKDGKEIEAGTDPFSPDTDSDGATDALELARGWDPTVADQDGDGILDGDDGLPDHPDAPFTTNDRLAIDADADVPDPEFEFAEGLVTWCTDKGEELWVAAIDPETKRMVPPDGKGTKLDENVAAISILANGPEWVQAPDGPQVVYARGRKPENLRVARAWREGGAWKTEEYPNTRGGGSPFGTLVIGDPDPLVLYCHECERFTDKFSFRWFRLLDPTETHPVPADTTMGRWADGSHQLVLQGWDENKVSQIRLHDTATGTTKQLTGGTTHQHLSYMWEAPELDGERLIFYVVGAHEQSFTYLQVRREKADGTLVDVKQIHPPMRFPYVVSPEPVVFEGKSYVSFLASNGPYNRSNGESEVWLAAAAPGHDFARRLSGPELMVRKDPESLIIGGDLVVYYSEVTDDGRRLTHVVDSGL
jgi:hypothetical protein